MVDFFCYQSYMGDLKFNDSNIRVFCLEKHGQHMRVNSFLKNIIPDQLKQPLGEMYYGTKGPRLFHNRRMQVVENENLNSVRIAAASIEDIIRDDQYRCFIGAEPGGLMIAGELGGRYKAPLIYYNLELGMWAEGEGDFLWKVFNKYERLLNQQAVATITQDNERAKILSGRNGIPLASILTVPVCADGPKYVRKTDWLRKKFNLSTDDTIILYAGYITDWAMCIEMAKDAIDWPDGRVLVLHSHSYQEEDYLRKLRKFIGNKVKLSLESVSYEDLPELIASADIGIALYKDLGKNFTLTGSASGKIAHYLKCGLPVISNNYPSIKEVLEGYDCGVCIESPAEMNSAIDKIQNKYKEMHENAYRCYEDRYMFSRQFAKVIDFIEKIDAGH